MLLGFGVAQRMYQDRYGDPGSPEEQHNASHQYVLQTSASGAVLFMGNGASPRGDRPFVDARPLQPDATAERVWRCPPGPTKQGDADEIPSAEVGGALVPEAGKASRYCWHLGLHSSKSASNIVADRAPGGLRVADLHPR